NGLVDRARGSRSILIGVDKHGIPARDAFGKLVRMEMHGQMKDVEQDKTRPLMNPEELPEPSAIFRAEIPIRDPGHQANEETDGRKGEQELRVPPPRPRVPAVELHDADLKCWVKEQGVGALEESLRLVKLF